MVQYVRAEQVNLDGQDTVSEVRVEEDFATVDIPNEDGSGLVSASKHRCQYLWGDTLENSSEWEEFFSDIELYDRAIVMIEDAKAAALSYLRDGQPQEDLNSKLTDAGFLSS